MIIHTKAKTKIHSHEAKSTGIKGHNVYSVNRSPKIKSATTIMQTMGKGTVRRKGKTTYRKSTIHQNQEKRGGRIHQHNRNIKDDKTYLYHIGLRDFELAELKLLVDSVQSSKFITAKKSNELIEKIERIASKYEAKQLQRQVFVAERIKTMNESIYYNVDITRLLIM